MTMHVPMRGKLLQCTEIAPQKVRFFIPFADFFQNEPVLYRTALLPDEPLIYAPVSGVLLFADHASAVFLICGRRRVALWLHTEGGLPLPLCRGELLSLADAGQPLKAGQLLARLELAALRRRGCAPYLSLLTPHPVRVE